MPVINVLTISGPEKLESEPELKKVTKSNARVILQIPVSQRYLWNDMILAEPEILYRLHTAPLSARQCIPYASWMLGLLNVAQWCFIAWQRVVCVFSTSDSGFVAVKRLFWFGSGINTSFRTLTKPRPQNHRTACQQLQLCTSSFGVLNQSQGCGG